MRFATLTLFLAATSLAVAQSGVDQPLTTNNAQSACVEFGDCTLNPQNTFTTATQNAPITAPASSIHLPPPTDAAQSLASMSSLALNGALSAYSSRVANGQPTGAGQPDGATVKMGNATVIAVAPSTSSATKTGKNEKDASVGPLAIGWSSFLTPALVALGTAFGAVLVL